MIAVKTTARALIHTAPFELMEPTAPLGLSLVVVLFALPVWDEVADEDDDEVVFWEAAVLDEPPVAAPVDEEDDEEEVPEEEPEEEPESFATASEAVPRTGAAVAFEGSARAPIPQGTFLAEPSGLT